MMRVLAVDRRFHTCGFVLTVHLERVSESGNYHSQRVHVQLSKEKRVSPRQALYGETNDDRARVLEQLDQRVQHL